MVHEVTDESFQAEVVDSPLPCVVEFTASWCAPCKEMAPAFEALSDKLADEVRFCRVDIDAQRALRIKFAVAAIPYTVFIADGQRTPLFDQIVSAERLEERIRFMLDGGTAPNTRPL